LAFLYKSSFKLGLFGDFRGQKFFVKTSKFSKASVDAALRAAVKEDVKLTFKKFKSQVNQVVMKIKPTFISVNAIIVISISITTAFLC
jgi:hypothetical protein